MRMGFCHASPCIDSLDQVGYGEAGAQELEPKSLPVKTQGEVLTGETAIGLVELFQLRRYRWGQRVHLVSCAT